jgi:hypothetical protein
MMPGRPRYDDASETAPVDDVAPLDGWRRVKVGVEAPTIVSPKQTFSEDIADRSHRNAQTHQGGSALHNRRCPYRTQAPILLNLND